MPKPAAFLYLLSVGAMMVSALPNPEAGMIAQDMIGDSYYTPTGW